MAPPANILLVIYALEFKKTALKDVGFKYRESGTIVQAIKALGKDHISPEIIERIRKQIDPKKCKQIIKDTKHVTNWIYDYIKQICMECE
jgi:hypothetical protein